MMKADFRCTVAGLALAAALSISAQPVFAQDALAPEEEPQEAPDEEADARADLERQVEELREREREYRRRLEQLEARLALIERGQAVPGASLGAAEAANLRGAYIAPRPVAIPDDPSLAFFRKQDLSQSFVLPSQDAPPPGGEEEEERRSPAPSEAVAEISGEQQGRFGDRLGFDLGLSYSHFDTARISLNGFLALDAIFLGTISIDQVKSDIFTFDPTIRYGISDRLFVDANLPVLYRTSNFRSGGAGGSASALIERTVHDEGIGDLNFGASYRLIEETASMPDVVVSARVRVPTGRDPFGIEFVEVAGSEGNLQVPAALATGTGVYGASIGWAMLKTLDPMVIFGNATYFHNFSRDFADIGENEGNIPGRVDIGDAFQFGAGLAFALNDKSSISMSYSQRIIERTRLRPEGQDSRIVVGSQANVGLVNLGATFSLSRRLALIANVGIGLTDDSPDMSVGIRLPFRF
jgi:hypothetical protein